MARGLTREMLVEKALEIVDRDGLDALSMRRLGSELGVDPMAAYRHLPNKDALLDGVVEAVVSEIDLDTNTTLPWQDRLKQIIDSNLRTLLAHPNVLPLMSGRPLTTPRSMLLVERVLEITSSAGVPLREAILATNVMGLLVNGLAISITASRASAPSTQQTRDSLASLPRSEYPRIVQAMETGQFIESYDQLLDFWFGALLARLEQSALPPHVH